MEDLREYCIYERKGWYEKEILEFWEIKIMIIEIKIFNRRNSRVDMLWFSYWVGKLSLVFLLEGRVKG